MGASGAMGAVGVTNTLLDVPLSPASLTAISDMRYSVPKPPGTLGVSPLIVMGLVSPVAGYVAMLESTVFVMPPGRAA